MTQGSGSGIEPSLPELLAQARAAVAEAVTDMTEMRMSIQADAQEQRALRDTALEEHARRARSGELGTDQQRLQERIDLNETSWSAVISGTDPSPEAEAVRAQTDRNAESYSDAVDAALETERAAGRPDPRAEALAGLSELRQAALAAIAEHGEGTTRGQ